MSCAWILDSGGAGRGAWQGGVLYELMASARQRGGYPSVMMGASAGGYAAADVATGTEGTVLKGWTAWGSDENPKRFPLPEAVANAWPSSAFRRHLHASIRYVMEPGEVDGVFDEDANRRLLLFTTRVRRPDGRRPGSADLARLFAMATTRKLPRWLKYQPNYQLEPVVFASHLPEHLTTEFVRPLTRENYHDAIEASCLVPLAMGPSIPPEHLTAPGLFPADEQATFVDGGFSLKMPMGILANDPRFAELSSWASTDHTVVLCCDPGGRLWETSLRLRALNDDPAVARNIAEDRLWLIYPDHPIEAGFLCFDPEITMRTFERGREQGRRLLETAAAQRFLSGDAQT